MRETLSAVQNGQSNQSCQTLGSRPWVGMPCSHVLFCPLCPRNFPCNSLSCTMASPVWPSSTVTYALFCWIAARRVQPRALTAPLGHDPSESPLLAPCARSGRARNHLPNSCFSLSKNCYSWKSFSSPSDFCSSSASTLIQWSTNLVWSFFFFLNQRNL